MARTLHLMFDLERRSFIGASTGGHVLSGVSSVVLNGRTISVLDAEGRDLLGGTAKAVETAPDQTTRAQLDVAAAFGAADPRGGR